MNFKYELIVFKLLINTPHTNILLHMVTYCYKDSDRLWHIVTDSDILLNMGTDCDRLLQIVTKKRLYGMSCILVYDWFGCNISSRSKENALSYLTTGQNSQNVWSKLCSQLLFFIQFWTYFNLGFVIKFNWPHFPILTSL